MKTLMIRTAPFLSALILFTLAPLVRLGIANPIIVEGDVPVQRGFVREVVVDGLERPWSVAWLPEGNMLVTERPGRLRLVEIAADGTGKLLATPIEGVPQVFAEGQGGLLDVSLHPLFRENKKIYFTYADGTLDANRTKVAMALYEEGQLKNWQDIFEVNTTKSGTQHFGARISWMPDNTLLVSIGDGGNPPVKLNGRLIREHAQDLDSHLGKVLRLNDDGTAPNDNPFVQNKDALPEIYSYGHRNIQGLAYDPLRKKIWASEHGALGGDELNVPVAGGNFGWPKVTYSREYSDGTQISPKITAAGYLDPVMVWETAIAPSGLLLYTGDKFKQWQGDLFAGALMKQSVRRLKLSQSGKIEEQRELRFGARIRDVRQGPEGFVYVLVDDDNGKIIRLKPVQGGDTSP
ncbi:MAG: PQQ-dependent sugar dehydrogenase [Desulfocapsaceae bacterium]|nr:PQQ-dependent sugar dehydrogenase [Desulfocapsaceae bacterium]